MGSADSCCEEWCPEECESKKTGQGRLIVQHWCGYLPAYVYRGSLKQVMRFHVLFIKSACAMRIAEAILNGYLAVVWDGKGTNAISPTPPTTLVRILRFNYII